MYNTRDVNSRKQERQQRTLRINLNIANAEERLVKEITDFWSKQKTKATHIRRAILLFADLQQGGVDRLLSEFPHVYDAIRVRVLEQFAAEHGKRLKEIEDYLIEKEEQALLAPPAPPVTVERERVALDAAPAKTSAAEVANNFLSSFGRLFD
jgi:hypothetical protein